MNSNFVALLHREIRRFDTFQDLVNVNSRASIQVSGFTGSDQGKSLIFGDKIA
jgi:hypothetical protein